MKITAANLLRGAGLSAMVAGIIFAVVGLIHPPQIVSSVTTGTWTIVHLLTIAMSFFGPPDRRATVVHTKLAVDGPRVGPQGAQ